jgi:hypothetical protein
MTHSESRIADGGLKGVTAERNERTESRPAPRSSFHNTLLLTRVLAGREQSRTIATKGTLPPIERLQAFTPQV